MTARPELVSKAARRAFKELATGTVLREIDGMWQDEGFQPGSPNQEPGERRSLYQQYLDAVDWTHRPHVERALRVFEVTANEVAPEYRESAYNLLLRDGYEISQEGRISGGPQPSHAALREQSLDNLPDAAAIREHLDRITRALEHEDPAQVIGSAKELIESTAKLVLREVGQQVDDSEDLPKLVQRAATVLGVHPSARMPGPDSSDGVKKILGGAVTITNGLAELRNRGYGTGHGAAGPRVGLRPRHAHLAIAGAALWCDFMLDTFGDPDAPWRKSPSAAQ